MITHYVRVLGVVGMLALYAAPAAAQAIPPSRIEVPDTPAAVTVPDGHAVYLHGFAAGTQNYICLAGPSGVSWRFLGPQATLYRTFKGQPRQQVSTHFLSADSTEARVARPVWQHSFDSSRVWGRVVGASTDAAYVEAGAIPWLLLEAAAVDPGIDGGTTMTETTFIQRVNTSGGTAPATGCSEAAHAGTLALVPYTTDYFFYRADPRR